jgi:hypothetical protein
VPIYVSRQQNKIPELVASLNNELEKIESWCDTNGLALNPSKTRAIVFQPCPPSDDLPKVSLLNTEIPYSETLEILGVTLKYNLSWDLQVAKVSRRVYSILHNLYRFKQYLSIELKTTLFKQLILPNFLYVSSVFTSSLSSVNLKCLSRALRTAVRFVYDRGRRDSISSYVTKLLSLPFEHFLKKHRLLSFFKILRLHHTPIYLKLLLDHGTSLRSSLIRIPELSSSWSQRCPIRASIIEWNKLGAVHRHCVEINRFRTLIHTYLSN